jgi:putative DNA primase/helicase
MIAAKSLDPEQPRRLVRAKSNIGPDGDGFEYSLQQVLFEGEDGLSGQRVIWGEPLYGSAQDLLNGIELPKVGRPPTASAAAKSFLFELLKDKAMPSQWVKNAAKEAGLAWRTVERAREELDIVVTRIGGSDGHWQWALSGLNLGDETDF